MGSKRQVVGFTWGKTRPSIFASTRTKLSSVSSGKSNAGDPLRLTSCNDKSLDLVALTLFVKWSAKSSHAALDSGTEDLLKSLFIIGVIVLKRNFGLFLFSVMRFAKYSVLARLIELL